MACRLFSDAIDAGRPDLKRSNSSLSLPSPPSTKRRNTSRHTMDLDGPVSPSDRYSQHNAERPRTSRARIPDRITEQQILAAREQRAIRDEAANPFLEKAGEIHEAKKLAPRTDGVTAYVFRGRQLSLDLSPFVPSHGFENDEHVLKPQLLFPTGSSPPVSDVDSSPVKKRNRSPPAYVPVTPQSICRPSSMARRMR